MTSQTEFEDIKKSYIELGSLSKVSEKYGKSRSYSRRIVDPESHERAKTQRNIRAKEKREERGPTLTDKQKKDNNKRYREYFGRRANE